MPYWLEDLVSRLQWALLHRERLTHVMRPLPLLHPAWFTQRDLEEANRVAERLRDEGVLGEDDPQ